jgi:PKD domain.
MRLRGAILLIGALIVGCGPDQSTVTTPALRPKPKASLDLGAGSLSGPTLIGAAGTYTYQLCAGALLEGETYVFRIYRNSTIVVNASVTADVNGHGCASASLSINEQTGSFQLSGEVFADDGNEVVFSTLNVTVNIFSVAIAGPNGGPPPFEGTWTATIINAGISVGPYTYQWSGDLSGTGSSITGTFFSETTYDLTLTVTDANGRTASSSKAIYICNDIC